MLVLNKSVLLLKAPNDDGNDKYETILHANGFTVEYLQLLDFQYINLDILCDKLTNPNDYAGIIFTSPRGVIATKKCLHDEFKMWENKNNYVVGESTFDLTKNELNLICKGKESGNANNLAELIITETCSNKKYLFPCGNLKKETLGRRLNEHNIIVDAITVYETIDNQNVFRDFDKLTDNRKNISEYVVFFSPSGVDVFKQLIPINSVELKLIAIGPSTEEKLKTENLSVFGVAKKPTETELLNAILKI